MKEKTLLERFLRYVKIDTQSDDNSETTPSTMKQYDLLNVLKEELDEMGVPNEIDEFGRLYACVEGNNKLTPIGLCSHVDTALECSGKNVNPQIIYDYDLSDISLGSSGLILSKKEFHKFEHFKGKTIITTDGTTLLGGDDKAGVAIIMDAVSKIVKLNKEEHNPMYILFTPDEEVGRGAEHFDKTKFKCKFAYTVDGSNPRFIEIDNFNAKSIIVNVKGVSIHPGNAKGIMENAALILSEFIDALPKDMIPAKTSKREGFNHLVEMKGDVENATAYFILRNHEIDLLNKQVETFKEIKKNLQEVHRKAKITLEIKDSYLNMLDVIKKHPECKEHIERVYKRLGAYFEYHPIRGGTDGATFSYKGVPTPNLGTGSYNHHSLLEFAVLEEMELMSNIVTNIFLPLK